MGYFEIAEMLFANFGWYSLLLVAGTTVLMIPLNLLYKKIMKKDVLDRLRKAISCLSVFIISLCLVAFFTGVVIRQPLTFIYLAVSSINCGAMAMLLWGIIKFIRDYGALLVISPILKSKKLHKWLKELGISDKLISVVNAKVQTFMKDKKIVSLQDYLSNEMALINQVRLQITGFVANDKLSEAVNNILQPIKNKLK